VAEILEDKGLDKERAMAKELKGGLGVEEVAEAAAGEGGAAPAADGLTEDILYATPAAAGNPSGASGEPDGKKPDEKPEEKAKPKAEEEVDDEDDEGEEEEEPEDKVKPKWDADRQRRDEAHAAERRELQGQAEAATRANQALAEEIRALREGRETAASAEENREVEAALAMVDQLSDLSEPAQIVAAVKAVKQLSLRAPKGGADAARMEKIEQAVQALARSVQGMGETISTRQGRDDLEGAMGELDAEFGPEFHNDALEKAGRFLLEQGRTVENPPTLAEKKIALRLAYTELAGKKPGKGIKPKPKPRVASDAGAGGGLQAGGMKRGSLSEVMQDMRKEGKLH